jgi:hypothetical protein
MIFAVAVVVVVAIFENHFIKKKKKKESVQIAYVHAKQQTRVQELVEILCRSSSLL